MNWHAVVALSLLLCSFAVSCRQEPEGILN